MPDVTPIRWDPKRLSSSVYAAAYLTAGLTASLPVISLLLLCLGRVILGIGQSFAGTGSTLWGVGVVGSLHIGRVIS